MVPRISAEGSSGGQERCLTPRNLLLSIENRNGLADHYWQIQLHGAPNLLQLSLSNVFSGGFRRTLHGFGRDFKASQKFDMTPRMVEWRFCANQSQHTADTGREIRSLDV